MQILCHKSLKKKQRKLIRRALRVCNLTLPETITVYTLRKKQSRALEGAAWYNAECDDGVILLNKKLSKKTMLFTLFHEVKHLEQYKKGWLTRQENMICWKGLEHTSIDKYQEFGEDYKLLPWELAADNYAETMMEKFYE